MSCITQKHTWIWCVSILFIGATGLPFSPVVTVSEGQLQGIELISRENRKYFGFLGVPYATIPEKFERSIACAKWSGVRDASKYGADCPHIAFMGGSPTVLGEEDCLFLNVFTPNINGSLPVIVYIHGEILLSSSFHGGAYFLDEDIVLVTINYRLGALGFLSTGSDGVIQGNNGLKDQNMALRYLKSNVASFGGNPKQITIMGQGSGAASVAYHILSPMSKNLFINAIMESGSALNPTHFDADPLSRAIELAESLDCPIFPTSDLSDCLRRINFRKIVQIRLRKWHFDPLIQYPPSIEVPKDGQSEMDLFLTENPFVLLQKGRFNRVPCVIGLAEQEGLLFHSAYILRNKELQRNLNEDWNHIAPITLYYDNYNYNIPKDKLNQISRTIRGFYFGNKKIDPDSSRNLTNLYSDRLFNWGVRTTALLQSKFSPVYTYIFGFLGEFSFLQFMYGHVLQHPIAPTHGDELQYFFNSSKFPVLEKDSSSEKMSKMLIQLWTWFASTGNMMKSLEALKIAWLPVGPEEIRRRRLKWCYINIQSKLISLEPFKERMEFWDNILHQFNKSQKTGSMSKDAFNYSNSNKEEL